MQHRLDVRLVMQAFLFCLLVCEVEVGFGHPNRYVARGPSFLDKFRAVPRLDVLAFSEDHQPSPK